MLKHFSVLYVEDDIKIREQIAEYLEEYFGKVYTATTGTEGLDLYECYFPDVLLLDIDLPELDGLALAKRIRQENKKVSIVMLTAHTEKERLLDAAELKLVKYLVKPIDLYAFNEMLDMVAAELVENTPHHHALGDAYCWDAKEHLLRYRDEVISLTAKEEQLLALMVEKRGQSVSFEEIMAVVWADEFNREISTNCVKNIVTSLRKKLPEKSIQNVYGIGYKLS